MSYYLSDIDAIKVHTFTLNLNGLTTTNPVSFNFLNNNIDLNFIPDFVEVKMACVFDPTNEATGLFDVKANFVLDNAAIVSVPALPITNANAITPNILHKFLTTSQLTFTVSSSYLANNPSANAYIIITLQFMKLKKLKSK